ncbi:hypothetical protein ACRALDRAFT_1075425 [Sodiomyces alcalophilus JCM 7366]|uniref:uncharacterized protein n=1 Tax=Sodiomyces alcalophilus JCM 7366 TaxID=591952 RepID=UPI0039B47680
MCPKVKAKGGAAALSASAEAVDPATQEGQRDRERPSSARGEPNESIAPPPSLEADNRLTPEEIGSRYDVFVGLPFVPSNYFELPARHPSHPHHNTWADLYAAAVHHMRRLYKVQPLHLITMFRFYSSKATPRSQPRQERVETTTANSGNPPRRRKLRARAAEATSTNPTTTRKLTRRRQSAVAGPSSSRGGRRPSSSRGGLQQSRAGSRVPSAANPPPSGQLQQQGQATATPGIDPVTGPYPILANPRTGFAFRLNQDGTVTQMRDPSTGEPLVYPINQPYSGLNSG